MARGGQGRGSQGREQVSTGYYLQDNPNPNFGQFGWPRTEVSGVIGVHTTESGVIPSGPDGGAENTAAFIARRTDPGGYHVLADADSRLKLVHPRYAAWADTTNNAHAMSVSGAMNAARWRDLSPARAAAIVRNMGIAAAELVRDAIAAGLLAAPVPARRITPAEAIAGSRAGFYGHGETNPGRRYDPGANFDWDLFLATYASAVNGGTIAPQGGVNEEDLMATPEQRAELVRDLLDHQVDQVGGGKMTLRELLSEYRPHVIQVVGTVAEVPGAVLNAPVPRGGSMGGETTLGGMVAWNDDHVLQTLSAIAATAAAGGASVEEIKDAVRAGLEEGVHVDVKVSTNGEQA